MENPSMTTLSGARLLGDVRETNLEKVLIGFRAEKKQTVVRKTRRPKFFPIPILNALAAKNFRATQTLPLAVTGRQLPLIYRIVSGLVSVPHRKTILVVDTEHRFDATRLSCSAEDIRHVYVHRPARRRNPAHSTGHATTRRVTPEQVRELVTAAETWMYYGSHDSGGREWWGTVVVGAFGAGDITAAWKGWLRVERYNIPGFFTGCTLPEALADRRRRQDVVNAAPWAASSQWGNFTFMEPHTAKVHATLTRRA